MTTDRSTSTRAERAPLSRERVLATAAAVADAEGLAAVTMRRVAGDLGVEAMSIYHHVPGKGVLLDGLVDVLVEKIKGEVARAGEGPGGGSADDWRAVVRTRCLAARRVMVRHAWGPGLIGSRTTIPAGVYGLFEEVLGIMVRGGVSYRVAHKGLHALGSMILGFVQELFTPAAGGGSLDPDLAESELAAMAEALPYITAMVASEMHDAADPTLGWCDSQSEFEFTLDLLLDGLAHADD